MPGECGEEGGRDIHFLVPEDAWPLLVTESQEKSPPLFPHLIFTPSGEAGQSFHSICRRIDRPRDVVFQDDQVNAS